MNSYRTTTRLRRAAAAVATVAVIVGGVAFSPVTPAARADASAQCQPHPEKFESLYWCEDFSNSAAMIGAVDSDWVIDLNGGSATVTNGELVLSAPSGTKFPFMRRKSTKQTPNGPIAVPRFPDTGSFRLTVGVRYSNLAAPHGTSVNAVPVLPTNNSPANTVHPSSWRVHHDATYGSRIILQSCDPTLHTYAENGSVRKDEVLYDADNGAHTWRDGSLVDECSAITAGSRPRDLYLGNPNLTALPAAWATLIIDYIRVDLPCEERGPISSVVKAKVEPAAGPLTETIKTVDCDRVVPLGL